MMKNAEQILQIIEASTEHLTAEQIHKKLRASGSGVVLATVYNNLARLEALGKVCRVSVEGCPDRYDKTLRHDHLVCKGCGKISDITLEDLTPCLQEQVKVKLLSYDLKLRYLCPACQQGKNSKQAEETDRKEKPV